MGKLLQTLDSLQTQDGHPDVEGRRIELDSLVHHLTVSEIRRLRIQLKAVRIPNDICLEFPIELLLCIAEYLELEEVIRARAVSRTWNRTFSTADFCIGIIKTHFRPVWEKRYRWLSAGQQNVQKEVLRQWLSATAKDRIRRRHGRYRSMLIHRTMDYDIEDWQYKNGRLAFRRDSSAFIVRDLRTGSTVTYMDENRIALGYWLLSDDFLIAVKNGPISLTAWPLSPKTGNQSIRLPGPVLRITAHQDRVGIVTAGYQILIWYIGDTGSLLKSVDNPELNNHLVEFRLTQALVVFHPLEQECFFVVYEAKMKRAALTQKDTHRIVVQEFTKEKLMATKWLDLSSFKARSLPIVGLLDDGIVGISKLFVDKPSAGVESEAAFESRHGYGQNDRGDSNSRAVIMATFDIYRRKFILEDYCLPDSLRGVHRLDEILGEAFHWRHQILIPIYRKVLDVEHMLEETGALLVAINEHKGHTSSRKIPWYGPGDNELCLVQEEKNSDTAYHWIGNADFTRKVSVDDINRGFNGSRNGAGNAPNVVLGDDDFVVLMIKGGWAVWCFDNGIMDSTSDPGRPVTGTHPLTV